MYLEGLLCRIAFRGVNINTRGIGTTSSVLREFRKNKRMNIVKRDEGIPQGQILNVEPSWLKRCAFPDEDTPNLIFNGVRYADLPVVDIRVSPNNTIMTLSDSKGITMATRSCGTEGFKNCKKGTNIAAQATAIALATRAKRRGLEQVRVTVKGLGPGRMASIKGLEMAGMDIISITDRTPTIFRGPRPRKQKRL